eukprot:GILJ01034010.1.p2 GENE.GILJ01034010.1~~GILJ01034010.1.p2  ORF type:complete len:127 (+),score=1.24 GILJ01034010.1:339-719(+)
MKWTATSMPAQYKDLQTVLVLALAEMGGQGLIARHARIDMTGTMTAQAAIALPTRVLACSATRSAPSLETAPITHTMLAVTTTRPVSAGAKMSGQTTHVIPAQPNITQPRTVGSAPLCMKSIQIAT